MMWRKVDGIRRALLAMRPGFVSPKFISRFSSRGWRKIPSDSPAFFT